MAKGLPASPGAATGQVVFDADEAEQLGNDGKKVILVRSETTPDDIHGIVAAQAVVTSRGGMTSHAAVVARGMGKACICGCEAIKIDLKAKQFTVGETVVKYGDIITIDGSTGEIMLGEIPMIEPSYLMNFKLLLSWADEERNLVFVQMLIIQMMQVKHLNLVQMESVYAVQSICLWIQNDFQLFKI